MNPANYLTSLMAAGDVVALDADLDDPDAAARLASALRRAGRQSMVAFVAAPKSGLGPLSDLKEHRARLYFSTLDDSTVDMAVDYIDRLMPGEVRLPDPATLNQLYRNVRRRVAFLEEYETWTAKEVAEFAGSRAKNISATAARWREEGRIFAVEHDNDLRYPAFQFDLQQRRPKSAVAPLLEEFHAHDATPWEMAIWLTTPERRLGARPVDLLEQESDQVLEALRASYEVAI